MKNFTEMGLPTEIIDSLALINVTSPTDIQQQTIPLALEGHDILASSQTGSGKTLAYLLPTISTMLKTGGKALILTPTRELTMQVCETVNKMARKVAISGVSIIGGEPFFRQTSKLRARPNIIVGTPGRMIDHLMRKTIQFDDFRFLILDEMDSMLDMGMKKQLDQILSYMPKERQVLMFSATVPGHILEISHKYMKNPKRITIGSSTKPAPEVDQQFLKISQGDKYRELGSQLASKEGTAIVFVTTKRGADKLTGRLIGDGHKADVIHGGLNQNKRSRVIACFRAKKTRVLVATDVAARGLDINHIKLVFNYDLPMAAEDYLHRIGRTGRAGAKGHAISFVSPEDNSKMRAIERLINKGESSPRETFKKKGRGFESRNDFRAGSGGEGKQKRYGKKPSAGRKFGDKSKAGQEGFFSKKGNRSESRKGTSLEAEREQV
jgi:superfamily II DNA/RNA helicase